MDAPMFICDMTLFFVGIIFVLIAVFEIVVKSKPKPDYTKKQSE